MRFVAVWPAMTTKSSPEIRHPSRGLGSSNILKRLGGNENRFGSPLTKLAPDGIVEKPSYIRPLALLIFGNVFPSKSIR